MMCNVCQRVGTREHPLLFCDGKNCDLAVHMPCYGIPPEDVTRSQKWYCKRCEPHSTIRSTKVKCFACPRKTGALKHVADEQFCHVVCALWLDGISFSDVPTMRRMSVDRSALPVGGLQCYICHESVKSRESSTVGHTQKCAQLGCDRRMHVTCAQDRRLLRMPLKAGILDLAPDAGERVLFCEVHKEATPDPSPVKKSSKEQPSITLDDGTVIRVGDHVKAFWRGGRLLYEGTVDGINPDETIAINYHDGDYEDNVEKERIRPRLMVRDAKSAAAKTMAEQAKGDKKKVGPASSSGRSASAASVPPKQTGSLKRKSSNDSVVSPPGAKRPSAVKASSNGGGHSTASGEVGVRRSSSSSSGVGPPVSPPHSAARASKDPHNTPYADLIEESVLQYMEHDGPKVAQFLFRAHTAADTDVFARLRTAREQQRDLVAELEKRSEVREKLVRAANELLAPPPEQPPFCPVAVGETGGERTYSLQQSLVALLGCGVAGDKLRDQIKSMSEAIDRTVGL